MLAKRPSTALTRRTFLRNLATAAAGVTLIGASAIRAGHEEARLRAEEARLRAQHALEKWRAHPVTAWAITYNETSMR